MKKSPLSKIIWAVDTMEPKEFQKNAQFLIGALTRKAQAAVYPAHVLSFPYVKAGEPTDYEEAYLALAEKKLRNLPAESDNPQIQDGVVLIDKQGSVRDAVQLLLDYAKKKIAEAIVVSTHSRDAISRLFMGSFAETILLQSDLPVITVNPKTKVRESISKVLFPTTFSKEFRAGFQEAVRLCAALGTGRLTLLYQEPLIPMVGASHEFFEILEKENQARRYESNLWRDWAQKHGVHIEVHMDNVPNNVAEAIEDYATKHNFDLIVMISETKDADGPRVGSICRKVVRSAECPVWTMKTTKQNEVEFD